MIWNLANSSSALIDEDTKIDGYFIKSDGNKDVVFPLTGELDPVRQAKYGVANWADLTEAQLEAEIPYFDSVMSVNVEDGTTSELTIENRGKNLIGEFEQGSYNATTGLKEVSSKRLRSKELIPIADGQIYKVSLGGSLGYSYTYGEKTYQLMFRAYDASKAFMSSIFSNTITGSSTIRYIGAIIYELTETTVLTADMISILIPQLEEGSVATAYVPPRSDSITIPDTCELHGYNGVFDSIEYEGDSVANYTQRWKREDKNTDGGGAFVLTDYKADTKIICRNKTTGEVKVLDADDSVDTDWNSITAEVLYILDEAVESIVDLTDNGYRLPKLMNQIVVDSNLPIAMLINDEESVGYLHTQNFLEK